MSALLPHAQLKSRRSDGRPGRRNYLYLMFVIAATDFKIKYNNSALGYLWSLLKPLLMFGTLFMVFSTFARWDEDSEHYALYLLLGIIMWNFLSEVTLNTMALIKSKTSLLKKIYFPRWILVISSSLTSLWTLALNMCVFGIFFLFSGAPFQPAMPMLLLYIVEMYVLVVGLTFVLCALAPKFRDIKHIWEVFVQLGFWATPIIYPLAIVDKKYHVYIFLNPMARIIQGAREAVIGIEDLLPNLFNHVYIAAFAVVIFVAGLCLFNKLSRSFAEDL